jgi:hypothetical protein
MDPHLACWQRVHARFPRRLRGVGRSPLSEDFNLLTYRSEAGSVLSLLAPLAVPPEAEPLVRQLQGRHPGKSVMRRGTLLAASIGRSGASAPNPAAVEPGRGEGRTVPVGGGVPG